MEVVKGQLVISRQGRDVTHVYMVCGQAGERVLLADGKKRSLDAAKQKNLRHLTLTGTVLPPEQYETDLALRKAIAAWCASHGHMQKGG